MDSEMITDTAEPPTIEISSEDETESRTLDEEELKPSRRPLNKENVDAQTNKALEPAAVASGGGGLANRPEFALPTPAKRKVRIASEPSSFVSPPSTNLPLSTPPTSKLLRRHFAQISLTPKRPHLEAGPVRIENPALASTPKRFLGSGPVRVEQHHAPKSTVKKTKRLGYDGTVNTPSKELLRSTACSRNQQIRKEPPPVEEQHHIAATTATPPMSPLTFTTLPPGESLSEESVLDGSLDSSLVTSPLAEVHDRQGCENPVALTLLNDGKEDLQQLLERDVASDVDDSTIASCPSLLKVSSSLLDVMDQSDVAGLARPVPFRASRSQP